MKIHPSAIVLPLAAIVLTGCGAPPPVDFGGNWQPVNRFHNRPQEIPLTPAYTYYASPLDNTLRGMLRRWAKDNAMPLVWRLGSDYTLYTAVANLHATDLQAAVSELNKIYAAQGVYISADLERILVQPASYNAASTAPEAQNQPNPAADASPSDSAAQPPVSDD